MIFWTSALNFLLICKFALDKTHLKSMSFRRFSRYWHKFFFKMFLGIVVFWNMYPTQFFRKMFSATFSKTRHIWILSPERNYTMNSVKENSLDNKEMCSFVFFELILIQFLVINNKTVMFHKKISCPMRILV